MTSRVCPWARAAHAGAALAALLLTLTAAAAQAPLPADPAVRTGTLANGLKYFLMLNPRQPDRLFLQLAVKAGSIDEADDQRGVAHLLEHMAFNGSAHFTRPGQMIEYFQSIGSRVGPHINAATAYDSTTYLFDISLDRDGAAGRAFDAMRDVAGGLTIDGAELPRESRVVVEEWRGRLGAANRQRQPQLLALLGGSRYADRPVLGDPEGLGRIPVARVRDFYRDHYTPDRMALVVVGSLGMASMESLVHNSFDDLPARPIVGRRLPAVADHAETRYAVLSDPEAPEATVGVTFRRSSPPLHTVDDLRRQMIQTLATGIIVERFGELARRPDAPFLSVRVGRAPLALNVDTVGFTALIKPGNASASLSAVLQEIARAREHGFTDAELTRAKLELTTALQRAPGDSRGLAASLARHFLRDEPWTSPSQTFVAVRGFLPQITVNDVRAGARELWSNTNRIVMSIAPEAPGNTPIAESVLRQVVRGADGATVLPWQPVAPPVAAPVFLPPAGSVETRREIPDIGVTVLTLSNGVEVWLKPTTFNPGEVLFRASARGGAAVADPDDFFQAMFSPAFVVAGGVGGWTPDDWRRSLAGRQVQVRPIVSTTTHGITGSARANDLEAALRLAHLYFTSPHVDPAAFARAKATMESSSANQDRNPAFVFRERLVDINTGGFYMMRPPRATDVTRVDPLAAVTFYRDRFANAANFTFAFVGSFSVESITPLLQNYVASLPSKKTADAVSELAVPVFPNRIVTESLRKGREPRSQTAITFFADTTGDERQIERANALASILQMRLFTRLRAELGATYSVTAAYGDISPQRGFGTITITFGNAPDDADRLAAQALEESERLRRDGPTTEEVRGVVAARTADLRLRLARNDYWADSLLRTRLRGSDPAEIPRAAEMAVDALTVEGLADAARRYLPAGRYTRLTLLPEQP